jgi:hypothetical protein
MKKTLILYYSHSGNNRYLAERLAHRLHADVEALRPRIDLFGLLLFFSWIRLSPGNRQIRHDIRAYDRLILLGPIWAGQLIAPIRDAIRKFRHKVTEIVFLTCCGSKDETKDDPYGYGRVFDRARKLAKGQLHSCRAFPVVLAMPEDQRDQDEESRNVRLSGESFAGQLDVRLGELVHELEPIAESPVV